ncbi:MAG: rhomboid family intramembrane serine protease [Spirochaetota bacterium]
MNDLLSRGWVFKIILITSVIFLLQTAQTYFLPSEFIAEYFALIPGYVIERGFFWQIFTYMFLHGGSMHLLLNMYALFIFGISVEDVWGPKKFLRYYLFCGVGAGISIFIISLISQGPGYYSPTIGASGAVFGLLLAFGILFPDVEILLFFIIPIRAKYLVVLYGGLELFFELSGGMANVSHVGHLGGLLFGIIYFALFERRRWLKRKMKKVAEKFEKPFNGEGPSLKLRPGRRDENLEMKKTILAKLAEGNGIDSITDDEYQFMKYLDIMHDRENIEKHSIDITDEYISDRQFLETAKKYIQL